MPPLKLIALDPDDLAVLSAHLQDAVVKVADIAFLQRPKRFVMMMNRFDWHHAMTDVGERKNEHRRQRAAIRFERVLAAKVHGIDPKAKGAVLSLLAIRYEAGSEPPAGAVTLVFAGDAAIRLEVECIEAELRDQGAAWRTRRKPLHSDDGGSQNG